MKRTMWLPIVLMLLMTSCNKEMGNEANLKSTILVDNTSIQNAINAALPGDVIEVLPGTYNEAILLKNGVDIYLSDGVVIDFNGVGTMGSIPTISDGGNAVTCKILGDGVIKRTITTSFYGVPVKVSANESNIEINYKRIESDHYSDAVSVRGGTVLLKGQMIKSKYPAICVYPGTGHVTWVGDTAWSTTDYAILNSGWFKGTGTAVSNGNSAVENAGNINSYMEFSGKAISTYMYAFEHSGGTAYLHDVIIESTKYNVAEGSAISNYSGDTLKMSNVTMLCAHPDALSIESQGGSYGSHIQIYSNCYANRPIQINPPEVFEFGRELLFSIPPQNLAAVKDFKGRYKTITLTWQSDNNNFEVWKDGLLVSTISGHQYIDTIQPPFKDAAYSVLSVIPTLEKGFASITVEK